MRRTPAWESAVWPWALALLLAIAPTAGAQETPAEDGEEPAEDGEEPAEDGEEPAEDREEPADPVLLPPRLLDNRSVTLPEDAEPVPPDSSVELLLVIGEDGAVREAQVRAGVREDVDALVLEAAFDLRFAPATRDGEPIPARVAFRFRVSAPEAEPPREPEPERAPEPDDDPPEGEEPDLSDFDDPGAGFGVEATREREEPGAAARVTLEAEELTTVPGTFGEPLRVVARLPGVARTPFGLGFFLVRGAAFQNTGFLVDGFAIPLLYHFGAGPAVISSRLVDRLDFYPGGYPAAFGRFSAGIIGLRTAPPPTDSIRGELEIDVFRLSALGVVPFDDGKGSVAAAFRRSYYDIFVPLFVDGLRIEYTDYQLRTDYEVDDRLALSLFFFGSDDTLDQRGAFGSGTASANTRTATNFNFQRLIGGVHIDLDHGGRLDIRGMVGRDGTTFENAAPGGDPLRFAFNSVYLGLRIDADVRWTEWARTLTGFDINAEDFGIDASAFVPEGLGEYPRPIFTTQATSLNLEVTRALGAFYLDQVFDLGPLQISAALRLDYMRYGTVSRVFPDPRLVVRLQVTEEVLLKGATGIFRQPPSVFQLARTGGNPGLEPERSWQSSFGAEVALPENVELQSTVFYTQFDQVIRQVSEIVQTPDGPERQFFVGDGEGRAYGLELLLRRKIERGFYGWLSYTLSRSERRNPGERYEAFFWDQTHILNLAASYATDDGWRFGAAFQLATGRPTDSLEFAQYDADRDAFDPVFVPRGERLPTFHRVDIRIDREFDVGWARGSIYLDIQNVYNAPNNEGLLYSFDFSQTDRVPGLPILPTFGFRGIIE